MLSALQMTNKVMMSSMAVASCCSSIRMGPFDYDLGAGELGTASNRSDECGVMEVNHKASTGATGPELGAFDWGTIMVDSRAYCRPHMDEHKQPRSNAEDGLGHGSEEGSSC